jgi:hypothetical protein
MPVIPEDSVPPRSSGTRSGSPCFSVFTTRSRAVLLTVRAPKERGRTFVRPQTKSLLKACRFHRAYSSFSSTAAFLDASTIFCVMFPGTTS